MVSAAPTAPRVAIERVPCLRDNYVWLLHDDESGLTLVVDPSDAQPVAQVLAAKGWNLDFILNTHHHSDHTGGNLQLKRAHQCTIVGPKAEQARIPGIDIAVGDGDVWQFGSHQFRVFDTPGHTAGHCAFWAPSLAALFPGDTLFVLGCGRLFEGNPQQMWTSLSKLLPLPDDTRLFCAHEYSQANARWAVSIDPTNQALLAQVAEIDHLRSQGLSTVPGLLGQEKATNPCLRPHDGAIRQRLGVSAGARDWEAFAAIRGHKDTF